MQQHTQTQLCCWICRAAKWLIQKLACFLSLSRSVPVLCFLHCHCISFHPISASSSLLYALYTFYSSSNSLKCPSHLSESFRKGIPLGARCVSLIIHWLSLCVCVCLCFPCKPTIRALTHTHAHTNTERVTSRWAELRRWFFGTHKGTSFGLFLSGLCSVFFNIHSFSESTGFRLYLSPKKQWIEAWSRDLKLYLEWTVEKWDATMSQNIFVVTTVGCQLRLIMGKLYQWR